MILEGSHNIALDWAVRLAAEYHQQFLGFSGPGIDAEFKVLWFLKARGSLTCRRSTYRIFPRLLFANPVGCTYTQRTVWSGTLRGRC